MGFSAGGAVYIDDLMCEDAIHFSKAALCQFEAWGEIFGALCVSLFWTFQAIVLMACIVLKKDPSIFQKAEMFVVPGIFIYAFAATMVLTFVSTETGVFFFLFFFIDFIFINFDYLLLSSKKIEIRRFLEECGAFFRQVMMMGSIGDSFMLFISLVW